MEAVVVPLPLRGGSASVAPRAAELLPPAMIRRATHSDLGPLMGTVGVLVDQLYPRGALKLQDRLLDAINGYAEAFVASDSTGRPIALACESSKGRHSVKLGTFWVHPRARGRGVGRALLIRRQRDWTESGISRVHVTVREERAAELERLFIPNGFTRHALALNRYGEGLDEAVLVWSPVRVTGSVSVAAS